MGDLIEKKVDGWCSVCNGYQKIAYNVIGHDVIGELFSTQVLCTGCRTVIIVPGTELLKEKPKNEICEIEGHVSALCSTEAPCFRCGEVFNNTEGQDWDKPPGTSSRP